MKRISCRGSPHPVAGHSKACRLEEISLEAEYANTENLVFRRLGVAISGIAEFPHGCLQALDMCNIACQRIVPSVGKLLQILMGSDGGVTLGIAGLMAFVSRPVF